MRRTFRFLTGAVLALSGCGRTGSEIKLDPDGFASSRIAIVDFSSDSSAIRPDFPAEAFPTHVTPFHGKDWEVAGFSIRLFSPMEAFIQFDCSLQKHICVVAGRDIGLDSNANFQFPPSKKLLSFVAESEGKAGNLGSLPSFRLERKRVGALRSRFFDMNVVIGENKLGHTPEILSMGGYFDRSRYAVDSLVMQLKAEGATFESNSTLVVEPSNIHLVNLIHISEHEFGRENDSLSFPFSASTESNVADEGELIEIFLGSNAKWEKGGYLACDCKYTWYKVEFHLKGWEVITVEVDPCGEGFQEAIRVIQEKAFTLHLSPAHSRKLRDYFAPLVENQRKIRAATKGGSDPCSE